MVFVFQRCEDRPEPRCNGCIWVNSLVGKRPLHAARCLRNPSYSTCCQKVFSSLLVISLPRPSFFLISAVHLGHVLLFLTVINVWDGLRRFGFRLPIMSLCPVGHISLNLHCCLRPGTWKETLQSPGGGRPLPKAVECGTCVPWTSYSYGHSSESVTPLRNEPYLFKNLFLGPPNVLG